MYPLGMRGYVDPEFDIWLWHRVKPIHYYDLNDEDKHRAWLSDNAQGRWTHRPEEGYCVLNSGIGIGVDHIDFTRMFPVGNLAVWLGTWKLVKGTDYVWDYYQGVTTLKLLGPVTEKLGQTLLDPTAMFSTTLTVLRLQTVFYIEYEPDAIAFSVYAT